ncbi:MAG: transglutaminase family protein [Rhizobiales bacterium]|nr:transglutaminase family protein [Hyphomicrobiales bacterium]
MIYDVTHVTTYSYATPVTFARCNLRLTPRADRGQEVLATSLAIDPKPASETARTCFFGNRVTTLTIEKTHRKLVFTARSRVDVRRDPLPVPLGGETLAEVRRQAIEAESIDGSAPAHFLFPSDRVPAYVPAADYARESFAEGRPALEGALDLIRRIRADFTYDPDATKVSTPLSEAFAARHGVCQDFSHIAIAGLRGLGLPAAYVSGYLRTIPPPGKPRLAGADASHAWLRVWLGRRLGWIGLDPTNAIPERDDHVVLAMGRDYSDVAPVDGILFGAGGQRVSVAVDVVEVAADRARPVP